MPGCWEEGVEVEVEVLLVENLSGLYSSTYGSRDGVDQRQYGVLGQGFGIMELGH